MRRAARLFLASAAAASTILATTSRAYASTNLAILEYQNGSSFVSVPISTNSGSQRSPDAGTAEPSWIVNQGDEIESAAQPPDREIQFYGQVNGAEVLLCKVIVSYAFDGQAWQPGYRLATHSLAFVYRGQQLATRRIDGYPGIVQLPGPSMPNITGYFPTLEFGLVNDSVSVDYWTVQ